jgi:hypothetical protein
MRLKKMNQIALKSAEATVPEVEIRVYSAFMNPSDEVQPCFGPSSSTMGLLIFDQVHLMLRIFSCIR